MTRSKFRLLIRGVVGAVVIVFKWSGKDPSAIDTVAILGAAEFFLQALVRDE